jgi:hypothetical protein
VLIQILLLFHFFALNLLGTPPGVGGGVCVCVCVCVCVDPTPDYKKGSFLKSGSRRGEGKRTELAIPLY